MAKSFNSFDEFYPFYLAEHSNPICRRCHFVGSLLVIMIIGYALFTEHWTILWTLPLVGYGFAWMGHLLFEKNRPATFSHPLYSFFGDWVMFKDMLIGKIRW